MYIYVKYPEDAPGSEYVTCYQSTFKKTFNMIDVVLCCTFSVCKMAYSHIMQRDPVNRTVTSSFDVIKFRIVQAENSP